MVPYEIWPIGINEMKKSPKIAIDALGVNEFGGARSVTLPLLKKVFVLKKDWQFYCYLSAYEKEIDLPNVTQIIFPLSKGLLSRLIFQLIVPFLTIIYKIDITHFIKSQASLTFMSKKILTIYDCTILKFPEYFKKSSRFFWRHLQPIFISRMDQIITISNNAKSELIEFLNVNSEKITVIYPSSQFDSHILQFSIKFSDLKNKYGLRNDYLLYIGQIGLKKNLMTLVKAYHAIKKVRSCFPPLFLVGPRYYLSDGGEIFEAINALDLVNDIFYLGPLPENELYVMLDFASILLFPSVHEGFGLPMLEAMQLGTPVIASNISVMPEVLQDAGVFVDDYLNPTAWAETIVKLHDSSRDKKFYSQKGIARAKSFSWDTSAKQLIKVYERLL